MEGLVFLIFLVLEISGFIWCNMYILHSFFWLLTKTSGLWKHLVTVKKEYNGILEFMVVDLDGWKKIPTLRHVMKPLGAYLLVEMKPKMSFGEFGEFIYLDKESNTRFHLKIIRNDFMFLQLWINIKCLMREWVPPS